MWRRRPVPRGEAGQRGHRQDRRAGCNQIRDQVRGRTVHRAARNGSMLYRAGSSRKPCASCTGSPVPPMRPRTWTGGSPGPADLASSPSSPLSKLCGRTGSGSSPPSNSPSNSKLEVAQAVRAAAERAAGVAAERQRLARDIHITVNEGFASIIMLLEATEESLPPGSAGTSRRHYGRPAPASPEAGASCGRCDRANSPTLSCPTPFSGGGAPFRGNRSDSPPRSSVERYGR